jgi:xylulose-5-phosphate/fructose-6-phosphate phosphoketolase
MIDAYWRAANYLSVGQIYLYDNPLLREPLRKEHIKPRLLGHWGTTPGLNFIYVHLNRVIKQHDLNAIYVCGPGHGGPGMVANTYLEGTYSEVYPNITQRREGMQRAVQTVLVSRRHSQPRRAGNARLDPRRRRTRLRAVCTPTARCSTIPICSPAASSATAKPRPGRCATSWHSNKFLNPVRDGAVLPILHLNGYKIAGPTVLARIPHEELELFAGYGYEPALRRRRRARWMHQLMAATLDAVLAPDPRIQQADARATADSEPARAGR